MILGKRALKKACLSRRRRELKAIWPKEIAKTDEADIKAAKRRPNNYFFGRRIAVTLCVLLLLSIILAFGNGTEVFANAEAWIKEVIGEWKIVWVKSTNPEAPFASYELGWIPERFRHLVNEEIMDNQYSAEYNSEHYFSGKGNTPARWVSETGEILDHLAWGYFKISETEKSQMKVGLFDPEEDKWNITGESEWEINGWKVLCYEYTMSVLINGKEKLTKDFVCCIWADEDQDTAFRLDGNMTKEEAKNIILNVKKK